MKACDLFFKLLSMKRMVYGQHRELFPVDSRVNLWADGFNLTDSSSVFNLIQKHFISFSSSSVSVLSQSGSQCETGIHPGWEASPPPDTPSLTHTPWGNSSYTPLQAVCLPPSCSKSIGTARPRKVFFFPVY